MATDPTARLGRDFFARDSLLVARDLLGRVIRTRTAEGETAGRIIETEAYRPTESCSHSSRGRTARTASMFGAPGTVYVYFIYGMHHCVNLVTAGDGAAVLLRALVPTEGVELMRARRGPKAPDARLCAGPGSLCRALGIDRAWDGLDAASDERITVYAGTPTAEADVVVGPRIGVVGRPEDVALPWRWRERAAPARRSVR
jgi:DNA-3-methyladenine glycosylase